MKSIVEPFRNISSKTMDAAWSKVSLKSLGKVAENVTTNAIYRIRIQILNKI